MALSLLTGALALRPASQTALAAPPETPPGGLVENAQYQQVLAVAASQEQRLCKFGQLRKRPGYDLSDPFVVATSESDWSDRKPQSRKLEFAALSVAGIPCQVVGEATVVAFLKQIKVGKELRCEVRLPNGQVRDYPRSELLPLPTRRPLQGDWALAVGLTGNLAHFNGFRCICGISATLCKEQGFWVMFEPKAELTPPPLELLPLSNLVSLALPPSATRTPWEARAVSLPSVGELVDEAALTAARGIDAPLALEDGEDDDKSEALTEDEEEPIEEGDLVKVAPNDLLGIVKSITGKLAKVQMLALRTKDQEVAPSLETYPLALLAKSSEEEVTEVSTCNQCGEAKPEKDGTWSTGQTWCWAPNNSTKQLGRS
ncbi:unnamed protein product [Durusdinium trenchii]|uniref:Uncharacterized protein n=1 Tax=Durusdinium trenchii TaxID=1381693 RepID=A0ABP0PUZ0_9DINO